MDNTTVQPDPSLIMPPALDEKETTLPWQNVASTGATQTQSFPAPLAEIAESPILIKKSGIPPVVMGILTMFFLAGIVGGTFLISRGVSSPTPIAPNAPASEPKAFDPNEEAGLSPTPVFDPKGTVDCTNVPDTAPYGNRCVPIVVSAAGIIEWAPGAIESLTQ